MPKTDKHLKNTLPMGMTPWKPGQSGNLKGRPRKSRCLIDCIQNELKALSLNGQTTKEQVIAGILVNMSEKGNLRAIELLMSFTTPRPAQTVDLTSKGNELRPTNIFQIMNEETRTLLARVQNGERTEPLEINNNLPAKHRSLPEPSDTQKP